MGIPRHLQSGRMANFVGPFKNLFAEGVASEVNDFNCTVYSAQGNFILVFII